jgi:hypothetical protein
MTVTATSEAPWLLEVEASEAQELEHGTPAWWRAELEKFRAMQRDRNGLVTQSQAALILGVTPARVGQFCDSGQLERITIFDGKYVPADALLAFSKTERRNGRPPSKMKLLKAAFDRG